MSFICEIYLLWNVLSMKCLVCEMSCLWNVLYKKCPSSKKCPASMKNPNYEMSCLWNVLYKKCPSSNKCPASMKYPNYGMSAVYEMSGLENVHQYSSMFNVEKKNYLFLYVPYNRFLKIGKYLGENWAYCLVSYFQVFSCSIRSFSPFSLALTVCADFSFVLIHHQVLK